MNKSIAASMQRRPSGEPTQVIAVASGKGGAGKTTVSINLATALANRGHEVMLLDGDAGLADLQIALGLHPINDMSHVLRGELSLNDILLQGPSGIAVVPTATGWDGLSEFGSNQDAAVISAFDQLRAAPEVLIIDAPAGIAQSVQRYAQAASEVLVVLGDEHMAVRNAYTLIRVLHENADVSRFRVLVNAVSSAVRAQELFDELYRQVDCDMCVALHFIGHIPEDALVRRALDQCEPVVNAFPVSDAAQAFKNLARRTENWAPPVFNDGGVNFFVEQLLYPRYGEHGTGFPNHQQGREVA